MSESELSSQENQVSEFTSQEKAADISWRLASGESVTTREVADTFGITWHGAYKMLNTISRVIPIAPDDGGRWKRFCNQT